METAISEVEYYAQVALQGAAKPGRIIRITPLKVSTPTFTRGKTDDDILELATIRTFAFQNRISQTILYLLRQMEIRQVWRKKGFDSLNSWAYGRLVRYASKDKLTRLCAVTTKVILALDAEPMVDAETGEKITGLTLIERASPSALIRTSGAFAASENGERQSLLSGLLTGKSDDREIKSAAGWEPEYGKAQATWHWVSDDEFELTIRGKAIHQRIIENNLSWMLEERLD